MTRTSRRSVNLLASLRAAIDLASIMVGVLVIGLIAGVISATVFAVIPWAQDETAKGNLDAVRTAESAYAGMDTGTGTYGTTAELAAANLLQTSTSVNASTGGDGGCYVAVSHSQSGKLFYVTSRTANAVEVKPDTDTTWCTPIESVVSGIDGAVMPGVVYAADSMVSVWDTSIPGCTTIKVPAWGASNYTINWGDGTEESKTGSVYHSEIPQHTYTDAPGPKTVVITGSFDTWATRTTAWSPNCITEVNKWGTTGTKDLEAAFANTPHLTKVKEIPPTTVNLSSAFEQSKFNGDVSKWNTANVVSISRMFSYNTDFNQPVNSWNTSKVETLYETFAGAAAFNQPVNNWDTSNVSSMYGTFVSAATFNQPVSNWNTAKVTDMSCMFCFTSAFNQSVDTDGSKWDVSNVTSFSSMFAWATAFNQTLTGWETDSATAVAGMFNGAQSFNKPVDHLNVSKVTSLYNMFSSATAFNQPVNSWDVSQVTSFMNTFEATTAFDQPLNSWDTSKATDMRSTFRLSGFNHPIGNWDTSNVLNMSQMFYTARNFNQPIGSWDVSQVQSMDWMFFKTPVFDQPLSTWNTGSVLNMENMFYQSVFNRDISGWDVSSVTNHSGFADAGAAITAANQPRFP